ncbi:Protein YLS9 [Ananas comosus]|uniref:Protein YLS9 n=1 Tax=Ananas comosus TaxID=4615 RepID=A0A199V390_ANACO|nr:Protein YLS9 [Ananas comosus]
MADRVHPDDHLNSFPEKPKPEPEREPEPETETETDRAEYLPSFAEKPKPPPGTYLIQIPKDQVFRVPPPETLKLAAYTAAPPPRRRRRRRRCCCLLLAAAAALALALAAAAAALYFALRPKLPSFSLASLAINGLAPSSSSSSSPISPDLAAAIRARNPNSKIGLRYLPGGSVAASYGAVALANGAWPAFFQGRDNVTEFVTPLAGSGIRLSPSTRASMVTAQRNGAVPLTVDARLPVRAKVGAVTTWTWTVKVRCDVTVDELTANATIISQACHVKLRL